MGRHRLAAYLAQIMLASMERLLRADLAGGEELLGIAGSLASSDEAMSMDARYLATVVLAFLGPPRTRAHRTSTQFA